MQHNCPKCGARVEDGTPFCPKCDAPQIRVSSSRDNDAATPPLPPGTPDEVQPPAEPVSPEPRSIWQQRSPAEVPIGIDWKVARRVAIIAGVIGGLGTAIPIGIFIPLWVLAAGGISITIYKHRVRNAQVTGPDGFRIGASAGLFAGITVGVLGALARLLPQVRSEDNKRLHEQIERTLANTPDPNAQQMIRAFSEWIATPVGFAVMFVVGIVVTTIVFIIIAGLGGSIGASLFGKHRDTA